MGGRDIMPVELIRDIINYEKMAGEGSSQTMVNGDIVLGERNPEFVKILGMDGKVIVVSNEVIDDRVIVEGKVVFDILYSSNEENPGVFKVNASSNFNHTIQVPGTLPKMSCRIMPEIEHMEKEIISNKKIKVNAVINLKATVYEREVAESVTDIKGQDIQLLKENILVDEFLGDNNTQTIIKGKMELPEDKGEVKSILKSSVHIHKKDVNVMDGKIIINACALARIICDTTGGMEMYSTEQDIAFTHEINMAEIKPDMKCDVAFKLGEIDENIRDNENGEKRVIEIEIVVNIGVKVYAKREMQMIVDAYSPQERYELEKQNIKIMSYFNENTDNQTLKEKMILPEDADNVGEIKYMTANPVITDVKLVEDKAVVEGMIECSIVYSTDEESPKMANYEEEFPVKFVIDIPEARIDMMPDAVAYIEHMYPEKVSGREVNIKVAVECNTKVYNKTNMDIVKAVQEMDIPDSIKNMPSIIIYTIQHKDTLWKIAKKYATTIEDIVIMNELDNPDYLESGLKILIPKKTFMK
jgi:hypothetical protein